MMSPTLNMAALCLAALCLSCLELTGRDQYPARMMFSFTISQVQDSERQLSAI